MDTCVLFGTYVFKSVGTEGGLVSRMVITTPSLALKVPLLTVIVAWVPTDKVSVGLTP